MMFKNSCIMQCLSSSAGTSGRTGAQLNMEGNNLAPQELIFKDISLLLNTVFPYLQWPSSCALANPGKIGGGRILRDQAGDIIFAFIVPLGTGTNNQAEVQAAVFGLNWCYQHGYRKVVLEVDSELLTHWLNLNINPPWKIQQYVQELQNLIQQMEAFQCLHTYREANTMADFLAKLSHKKDILQLFYTLNQLPIPVKGSYLLEKIGMINFRRRKLKRIKKPP
ncbi:hypothetical protein KY284_030123 [Solanum tuberosum]|nr:hypothetical protein KY284_030123 [Solanum tuberosum]